MTHSGVPLYGDGQCEVDGTSKADVSHWEEDWDEIEEEGGSHDPWNNLWQPEYEHCKDDVQQIIACKTQQKTVKVFLEHFSAEQEDCKAISNNAKAANKDLERQKLPYDRGN